MRHVDIHGHLVLPFGTATKSDIGRIRLARVATTGIRLESDVPVVHIDKSSKEPLKLQHFMEVFNYDYNALLHLRNKEREGLAFIKQVIQQHNPNMTKYEELFVNLYFDRVVSFHEEWGSDRKISGSVYSAFMPIPEMQIYVADPLDEDGLGYEPKNNFRVDYSFWNGQQLVAVEIDGAEPEGYARDLRRDRMLRRAGVDVVHILNMELEKHRERALRKLLPFEFWGSTNAKVQDPFDGIPF